MTNGRTDRQKDRQGQILMPPDYCHGGIIEKKKITWNYPKYNNVCSYGIFLFRSKEQVRNSSGKRAISVGGIDVITTSFWHHLSLGYVPYFPAIRRGFRPSRMTSYNLISPMKFCYNTNSTLLKQCQSSRSILQDGSRTFGLFWKEKNLSYNRRNTVLD